MLRVNRNPIFAPEAAYRVKPGRENVRSGTTEPEVPGRRHVQGRLGGPGPRSVMVDRCEHRGTPKDPPSYGKERNPRPWPLFTPDELTFQWVEAANSGSMTELKSPVPDPGPGAKGPGISRAIYGMPMFATLLARDIRATESWYTVGLGFINLFTIPGTHGEPALVHLRRWQFQDLLVRPAREPAAGGAAPSSGCTLNFAAVYDEIDVLAERARAHGGGRVDGPADTPWNTRDLTTADPDGNIVTFTAARPPELADAAFSEQIHQLSNQQSRPPMS